MRCSEWTGYLYGRQWLASVYLRCFACPRSASQNSRSTGPLLDEVFPQDVSHRLCAIAGTELVQDVPEMGFNRSFGHH